MKVLLIALMISSCANPFKKDNVEQEPINNTRVQIQETYDIYVSESRKQHDSFGFVKHGSSIGDSALFTCISYAAGSAQIDIMDLFKQMPTGLKPIRHPNISPSDSSTPISKDMFGGVMLCLYKYGLENRDAAKEIAKQVISFGRSNKYLTTWSFCTEQDKEDYDISTKDFLGRCVMAPSTVKDFFRVAIWLGWECDEGCKLTMATSPSIPVDGTGFQRHLAIWSTWRAGKTEGAINDLSLSQLKSASDDQKQNGIYAAVYATFSDGDMTRTGEALTDETWWPKDHLPTGENFSTGYLWQRDETRNEKLDVVDGCVEYFHPDTKAITEECDLDESVVNRKVYNDDYLPGGSSIKTAEDWMVAAAIYLGKL